MYPNISTFLNGVDFAVTAVFERRPDLHPWMAVWIWSMAVSRVARDSMFGVSSDFRGAESVAPLSPAISLGDYFQSEIVTNPLPTNLLDRLADLYWTERESELPI